MLLQVAACSAQGGPSCGGRTAGPSPNGVTTSNSCRLRQVKRRKACFSCPREWSSPPYQPPHKQQHVQALRWLGHQVGCTLCTSAAAPRSGRAPRCCRCCSPPARSAGCSCPLSGGVHTADPKRTFRSSSSCWGCHDQRRCAHPRCAATVGSRCPTRVRSLEGRPPPINQMATLRAVATLALLVLLLCELLATLPRPWAPCAHGQQQRRQHAWPGEVGCVKWLPLLSSTCVCMCGSPDGLLRSPHTAPPPLPKPPPSHTQLRQATLATLCATTPGCCCGAASLS
jgi:hypothetical protein